MPYKKICEVLFELLNFLDFKVLYHFSFENAYFIEYHDGGGPVQVEVSKELYENLKEVLKWKDLKVS